MHQNRCVELARQAVVDCGERNDYMPKNDTQAKNWVPHRWVIDAMLAAAHEAEQERDQYRSGNTELLELWMKLFDEQEIDSIRNRVYEILTSAGLLSADGVLDWAALEARKPKPKTWAEAVNECVTDPEVRAKLLALGDDIN